jgi:hypothetical protein
VLVVKDTPFEVGWLTWAIKPPVPSLVVVVKGTFELGVRGPCTVAAVQTPLTGDEHADGDAESELLYDSDFAILKPRGEVLLRGTCHAPRKQPSTAVLVAFRAGAIRKELAVLGDRHWKKGLLGGVTDPLPFVSMPLGWSRSFGGMGHDDNPIGRGLAPDPRDPDGRIALPNIESPSSLLRSPGVRPPPAGASPLPKTHRSRLAHAGRYDVRWRTTRYPWFPADFSYAYFNAAPRDQQIVGYWRGDEPIELTNLHPEHAHVRSALPGLRPRAFVARTRGGPLAEVPLVLDTIAIDSDSLRVACLWRGSREVAGLDETTFADLYASTEKVDGPRTLEDYAAAYARCLEDDAREELEFEAVPMPGGGLGG